MTHQEPWRDSLHGCLDSENAHFSILKNIEGENKDEDGNEEKNDSINRNTKSLHAPGYDHQVHGKHLVANTSTESPMIVSPSSSDNTSSVTTSTDISPVTTTRSDISSIQTPTTNTSRTNIFISYNSSSQQLPPPSSTSSPFSLPTVSYTDNLHSPTANSAMFSSLRHNSDMFTPASNPGVFPVSTSTDMYPTQTNTTSSQSQADSTDNSNRMQRLGIDIFQPPPPPFGSCSDISPGISSDISFADAPSTELFSSMTSSRESYSSPSSSSHVEGFPGPPLTSSDIFNPPPHPFSTRSDVPPSVANVSPENDPYGTDVLPSSSSITDMSSSFSSLGTSSSDNYSKFPKLDPNPDMFHPPPPPFQSLSGDGPQPTHKQHHSITEGTSKTQSDVPAMSGPCSSSVQTDVDIPAYPSHEADGELLGDPVKSSLTYANVSTHSNSTNRSSSPTNKETLPDIINDALSSSPKHPGTMPNSKKSTANADIQNSIVLDATNSKASNINNNLPLSTSTEIFPLSTQSDMSALSTSAGISPLSSAPDISPFADYPPPSPPLPPPPLLDTATVPVTTPVTDISSSVSLSPDIYPLTNDTSDDIPVPASISDISISTSTDMITRQDARKDLPRSESDTSPPHYRISTSGLPCSDTHPFASKTDLTFSSEDRPRNVDRYTFSFESENSPPPSSSSDEESAFPVFPISDISPTRPIDLGLYQINGAPVPRKSASCSQSQSSTLERRPFRPKTESETPPETEVTYSQLDNKENNYRYTDDNDNVLCVSPQETSDNFAEPLVLPKFDISLLCTDGDDPEEPKVNSPLYPPEIQPFQPETCMENSTKITSTDIYPSTTTATNVFSTSISSSGVSEPSPACSDMPCAMLNIHASREDDTSSNLSVVSDDNNNNYNNDTNNNNDSDSNNNTFQIGHAVQNRDFSSDSSTSSESSSIPPSEDLYPNSPNSTDYSLRSRETTNISSSLSADTFFTTTSLENYPVNTSDLSPATDISSPSSETSFFTTCASPMRDKVFPDIANNNFSLTSTSSSTTTDSISPSSILSSPTNNLIPKETQNTTEKSSAIVSVRPTTRSKESDKDEQAPYPNPRSGLKLDPRVLLSRIPSHSNKQENEEYSSLKTNLWRVLTDKTGVQQLREIPVKTPTRIVKSIRSDTVIIRSIKSFHQKVSKVNEFDRSISKPRTLSLPSYVHGAPNITGSTSPNSLAPHTKPNELKGFHSSSPAPNIIIPPSSCELESPTDDYTTFSTVTRINQSTNSCMYCSNAHLIPPPHVFSNQRNATATMDLLPTFGESFPSSIDPKRLPTSTIITLPGSSWEFSFITYPGETYPTLMEISSPTYDLFSPRGKLFTTGQTKFFLDLTQLHFLGQRSKTDTSQRYLLTNPTDRSLWSRLESLKLPPERCITNYPSSSSTSSANVFDSESDYIQLVVRILCECRRRLWSHYVPTLVCPSDAPPRVTPAEHKLWPKLMPSSDDSFNSLVVSGKLFQEVLSRDFLPIFIREFCTSSTPGSFYPGTLPLLLPSSRAGEKADCSIMTNRGELRNLFQRCLLAAEDSIRCLRWDDLMSTPPPALPGDPEQPLIYRGVEEDENNLADTDKLIHFDGSLSFLGDVALGEGESLSTPSSPRSVSSCYSQKQKRLIFPEGIKNLDYKLLHSGVSIYPGSQALDGSAVGFVFSSSPLWRNQQINSTELAQQFLYFNSLTRKHGKSRGLTLVADLRGSTGSTVNTLLEALHLFQTNCEQDLQTVYLLANQEDQSLIKGSPLYDIHGPLKIDLLMSLEMLQSYVAMDQLPRAFDGQLDYNHESWVRFHTKLEPFMADCQLVDKYLKDSLSNITAIDKIPSTYDETNRLLWEHEQQVRSVFDAPQLLLLQEEGDTILNQLQQEEPYLGQSQDYKEEMVHVKKMYKHLQNSMMNLVKVAETRFHKLEQGLQLRGFENECNKLNIWISTEGRQLLTKYNSCIDNLKSAKMLEDQFLKDYFSAMANIDKGNDLVEEACMLSQSGVSTDSATGYRDIVKSLKIHLKTFVDELEDTRVKVEGTAKTYHTLDKAYAWALESMKYVVSMKTENCTTEEKLDGMLRDMDTFIQEHPPISPEVFTETLNQAKQLKNEKLISQCQRTIARCEETQSKLNSRKTALQRAKVQLLKAKSDSPCNCIVKSSGPDIDDPYLLAPAVNKKTSSWHVTCTSLPTSPKLHPRRSSLPNKVEVVHVSPMSNLSSQNMEEYQEQLFNDGLITEDMSHRIVTSLPKSLTLRPTPDNDCDTHGHHREGGLFSRLPFSKKHMTRTVTIPVAQSHSMSQMQLSSSQTIPQMDGSLTIEPLPRTLSLILQELISTERDYVWALKLIVDNYIPEIKKEEVPQALRGKRNVIFGNIEKIYEFHSLYFLQELENCKQQPFQIAQTFLCHEEHFYLYALYNKNKPKSDQLMQEHGTVYFRKKQAELNDKMNLSSYLLRPVQRMGKYALLLKQMLKECPESDNEFADLKSAEEMVKFHLRHGNDLLAMDSLKDCDVNLQEQGRLLRQDEFMVTQGRKKFMRHIFLFDDLILFSKTKRNRQGGPESYVYKYSFKTSDIGLTENFRDKSNKFEIWFRRRSLGENYILHAQCSEMKNSWVGEISRLLWKQAIKNRESRKCEMASMGMGNKPSMDLKARSRNSIAVTSVDHFRNGNKRPISITSLSSTSSSSSGQSANHGLLNSLSLAFEALNAGSNTSTDSPHFNRRSMNSSNESGICTDMFLEGDVSMSNRGIPAGSNSAATLPANIRLLPPSARSRLVADFNEKIEELKNKPIYSEPPKPLAESETPTPVPKISTPITPKQADPGKLWLDLSKIRTPPEFKIRVVGPTQPKISSIDAEESEL